MEPELRLSHMQPNVAFSRALQRVGCNALFGGIVMRRNPG
jgi:hypothetical protein